jgi:hypothetical protein
MAPQKTMNHLMSLLALQKHQYHKHRLSECLHADDALGLISRSSVLMKFTNGDPISTAYGISENALCLPQLALIIAIQFWRVWSTAWLFVKLF